MLTKKQTHLFIISTAFVGMMVSFQQCGTPLQFESFNDISAAKVSNYVLIDEEGGASFVDDVLPPDTSADDQDSDFSDVGQLPPDVVDFDQPGVPEEIVKNPELEDTVKSPEQEAVAEEIVKTPEVDQPMQPEVTVDVPSSDRPGNSDQAKEPKEVAQLPAPEVNPEEPKGSDDVKEDASIAPPQAVASPEETCVVRLENLPTRACNGNRQNDCIVICRDGKKPLAVDRSALPAFLKQGHTLGPCGSDERQYCEN